jgi:transcriptional antiterminator RfaH
MWRWYVVHTKPLGEATARLNLERQGYDVYFPRLQQSSRRRSRMRQIVPLFPRYLFLHFEEGQQSLAPVHSTLGVAAVVRFGVRYAIVPDEVITNLQLRADPVSGLHHSSESALAPYTPVTVTGGPFESLEGLFARSEGSDRVLILLKLLGHEARVQVPADMIEPSRRAA